MSSRGFRQRSFFMKAVHRFQIKEECRISLGSSEKKKQTQLFCAREKREARVPTANGKAIS